MDGNYSTIINHEETVRKAAYYNRIFFHVIFRIEFLTTFLGMSSQDRN